MSVHCRLFSIKKGAKNIFQALFKVGSLKFLILNLLRNIQYFCTLLAQNGPLWMMCRMYNFDRCGMLVSTFPLYLHIHVHNHLLLLNFLSEIACHKEFWVRKNRKYMDILKENFRFNQCKKHLWGSRPCPQTQNFCIQYWNNHVHFVSDLIDDSSLYFRYPGAICSLSSSSLVQNKLQPFIGKPCVNYLILLQNIFEFATVIICNVILFRQIFAIQKQVVPQTRQDLRL